MKFLHNTRSKNLPLKPNGYHFVEALTMLMKNKIIELKALGMSDLDVSKEINTLYQFKLDPLDINIIITTPSGQRLLKEYKAQFEKTLEHIELASRSKRLQEYQEMFFVCKDEFDKLKKLNEYTVQTETVYTINKKVVGLDGQTKDVQVVDHATVSKTKTPTIISPLSTLTARMESILKNMQMEVEGNKIKLETDVNITGQVSIENLFKKIDQKKINDKIKAEKKLAKLNEDKPKQEVK